MVTREFQGPPIRMAFAFPTSTGRGASVNARMPHSTLRPPNKAIFSYAAMQRLGPGNMRYVAQLQKPAARQIVAAVVVRGLAVGRG